jgi:hypothetical protein
MTTLELSKKFGISRGRTLRLANELFEEKVKNGKVTLWSEYEAELLQQYLDEMQRSTGEGEGQTCKGHEKVKVDIDIDLDLEFNINTHEQNLEDPPPENGGPSQDPPPKKAHDLDLDLDSEKFREEQPEKSPDFDSLPTEPEPSPRFKNRMPGMLQPRHPDKKL